MSGLSEQDVIELKHGMAGIAEVTHHFYGELREQGFKHSDAMALTAAWLRGVTQPGQKDADA